MKKLLLLLFVGCSFSIPKEATFDPHGLDWQRGSLPLLVGFIGCNDHCGDYDEALELSIAMFNDGAGCELFRYIHAPKNDGDVDFVFTSLPRKDDYTLDSRWKGNTIELGYMDDTVAYLIIAHNLGHLMGLATDDDNNSIMMDSVVDVGLINRKHGRPLPDLTKNDAEALHKRYCE